MDLLGRYSEPPQDRALRLEVHDDLIGELGDCRGVILIHRPSFRELGGSDAMDGYHLLGVRVQFPEHRGQPVIERVYAVFVLNMDHVHALCL